MFWKVKCDNENRLLRMFWCDGVSRSDYAVFGDILAFDATYRKNKYKFLVIIFSGVNHHNQTCVFGDVVVSNENEDTYVWVLCNTLSSIVLCLSHSTTLRSCYCYLNGPCLITISSRPQYSLNYLEIIWKI